jgi:Asp-tRNA(Asn)/Glu-tRNA(Gln) amidotransferase C subunit
MRRAERMMNSNISVAPKGIIETLRERVAELEHLEATGASTADTHEELVDIHEFLDRLYTLSMEHSRKTLHSHVWRGYRHTSPKAQE